MKLLSTIISGAFGKAIPLPSGKGRGGAKLDPMLWGFIVRLKAYFQAIGQAVIPVCGLIENQDYVAVTGQDGKQGLYIHDGKEIIGPLGCPSLGKIMVYFGLDMENGLSFAHPDEENPDIPDIRQAWNRDGVDEQGNPDRCPVRPELAKMIKHYTRVFQAEGNPFLAFEQAQDGQGELSFDDSPENG